MTLPDALSAFEWIHRTGVRDRKIWLDIRGRKAWISSFPEAYVIAMDTDLTNVNKEWLRRFCLSLFTVRESFNDSLVLEGDRLFLLRRYPAELLQEEWGGRINHQITVVEWMVSNAFHSEHCKE